MKNITYVDMLEAVACAALHMAGMSLPDILYFRHHHASLASIVRNTRRMDFYRSAGHIRRTVTLTEAAAVLKATRRAGFEYVPVTEDIIALGILPRTDRFLRPGLFISAPDRFLLEAGTWRGHCTAAVTGTRTPTSYGLAGAASVVAGLSADSRILVATPHYDLGRAALEAALRRGMHAVAFLADAPGTPLPAHVEGITESLVRTPGCAVATATMPGDDSAATDGLALCHYLAAATEVYIPECRKKGPANVTARLAKERMARVYAIPGRLTDEASEGCNALIRDGIAALHIPKPW